MKEIKLYRRTLHIVFLFVKLQNNNFITEIEIKHVLLASPNTNKLKQRMHFIPPG